MKKRIEVYVLLACIFLTTGCAGKKSNFCGKTFGGALDDIGNAVIQTDDGGYLVAGVKSLGNISGSIWVLKFDAAGVLQWEKSLEKNNYISVANAARQTADGGYVVAGYIRPTGGGQQDAYLIRLDPTGSVLMTMTYGGDEDDAANDVIATEDGGIVAAGYTNASDASGEADLWVFKLTAVGAPVWDKLLSGERMEIANSVAETADSGFVVAGTIYGTDTKPLKARVLKLDSEGVEQWSKSFGEKLDMANNVVQTADGGYFIAGYKLIKLDATGVEEWSTTYAGVSHGALQTADGGFILAENSKFWGPGGFDVLLIKTNAAGKKVWAQAYGGEQDDQPRDIAPTSDGGYIVTGYTQSFGSGGSDLWVFKIDSKGKCAW